MGRLPTHSVFSSWAAPSAAAAPPLLEASDSFGGEADSLAASAGGGSNDIYDGVGWEEGEIAGRLDQDAQNSSYLR